MEISEISRNNPYVYMLAEVGINHDSDVIKAIELIDACKESGADGVKFQLIHPEKLINPFKEEKGKIIKNPVIDIFKKYELKDADYITLAEHASKREIDFLCTTFDDEGLDFIDPYVSAHKVSSGDVTHIPFLKKVGSKKKPVILSSGMSDLSMVRHALSAIKDGGGKEIILLHCVSCYPPYDNELNLNILKTLYNEFEIPIGFSDHSEGLTAAIASYALGARFIEKHVTLDKSLPGADHAMSIEIKDFQSMIKELRRASLMMGNSIKEMAEREKEYLFMPQEAFMRKTQYQKGALLKKRTF